MHVLLGVESVRDRLFLPGHVVFFVFNSEKGLIAVPTKIADYEPQFYEFSLTVPASDSVSEWKPVVTSPQHKNSIFYIPMTYRDYFVQLFVGTDPVLRILLRYEDEGFIGSSLEHSPKAGGTFGYIESPLIDISPETEAFGFFKTKEPVFTFYNPKPIDVEAKIIFWGRRYRFVFLSEEEALQALKERRFTIRIVGNQLEPAETTLDWIPMAMNYADIIKLLRGVGK